MKGTFVHQADVEREQLDWGALGWISRPLSTAARQLTVIDVSLEPGHGHDFHRHPEQEEVIVVQAGEIEQWLEGVVQGSLRDWQLGQEIALCGRLIKGYGSTNERGKENLLHVLHHLAKGGLPSDAAKAVRAAREAALADDAGKALDATLVQHGAPPRPVKAVPIQWVRKPRGLVETEESKLKAN